MPSARGLRRSSVAIALGVLLSLALGETAGAAPELSATLTAPLDPASSPVPVPVPVKLALPRMLLTGASVEHAVAPLELGRVASGFGYRRARVRRRRQFHAGLDFNAERGAPVLAVRRGIVVNVASDDERLHGFLGYGNAVVLYHPDSDDWSFYAHLDAVLAHAGVLRQGPVDQRHQHRAGRQGRFEPPARQQRKALAEQAFSGFIGGGERPIGADHQGR